MIFYFDRESGKRVSKSTWTRSKAHGGTRFVRRSASPSPKEGARSGSQPLIRDNKPSDLSTQGEKAPSQSPRTYQEWKDYFSKLSKRKRKQIAEEEGYEGPEYETGVDY